VFILKGVKVLCFDTLLQVFILKELREERLHAGKPGKFVSSKPIRDAKDAFESRDDGISTQRCGGEEAGRRCVAANTGKNSTEVHGMSSPLLGIIRMEREGVEKAGV
jgi:hypothetical protein